MNRIDIYDGDECTGWFDKDRALCLAQTQAGTKYIRYDNVYRTDDGKLIHEQYHNNYCRDNFDAPVIRECSAVLAIELIVKHAMENCDAWLDLQS
jgi:hypothetical protein